MSMDLATARRVEAALFTAWRAARATTEEAKRVEVGAEMDWAAAYRELRLVEEENGEKPTHR